MFKKKKGYGIHVCPLSGMQTLSQKPPADVPLAREAGSLGDRNIMIDFSFRFSNVLARVVQDIVLNSFNSLCIYGYFSIFISNFVFLRFLTFFVD